MMTTTAIHYRIRWATPGLYVLVPSDTQLRPDYATRDELAADVRAVGGHLLSKRWEADAIKEALEIAREQGYPEIFDEMGRGHATFGRIVFGMPLPAPATA